MLSNPIIDNSYFVGDLSLPVYSDSDLETDLNNLIIGKQDYYLKRVLGEVEYVKFKNDLDANGAPQTQIWIDFLDGKDLTVTNAGGVNKTVYYKGFKYVLARLIYFEYDRYFATVQTAAGNVGRNTQNSTHVNPTIKIVNIYNSAIEYYGLDWNNKFNDYYKNERYYLGFSSADFFFNSIWQNDRLNIRTGKYIDIDMERIKPTVYNYLYYTNLSDETAFSDWLFTYLGAINQFNI